MKVNLQKIGFAFIFVGVALGSPDGFSREPKLGGIICYLESEVKNDDGVTIRPLLKYHYIPNDFPHFDTTVYEFNLVSDDVGDNEIFEQSYEGVSEKVVLYRPGNAESGDKSSDFLLKVLLEFSNGGHLKFIVDSDNFFTKHHRFIKASGTFVRSGISHDDLPVVCQGTAWDFR